MHNPEGYVYFQSLDRSASEYLVELGGSYTSENACKKQGG